MNTLCLRIFTVVIGLLCLELFGERACFAQTFVTVQKEPIRIHRYYGDGEAGAGKDAKLPLTIWSFKCLNTIFYRVLSQTQNQDRCDVEILVTGATMRIGLAVDVFLGKDASPDQKESEEGHVIVCDRVFQRAEEMARIAGEGVVGNKESGHGISSETAINNAVNAASERLIKTYRSGTNDVAKRICEDFDRFTKSSPIKMHASEAVDQCFRKYD